MLEDQSCWTSRKSGGNSGENFLVSSISSKMFQVPKIRHAFIMVLMIVWSGSSVVEKPPANMAPGSSSKGTIWIENIQINASTMKSCFSFGKESDSDENWGVQLQKMQGEVNRHFSLFLCFNENWQKLTMFVWSGSSKNSKGTIGGKTPSVQIHQPWNFLFFFGNRVRFWWKLGCPIAKDARRVDTSQKFN